MNLLKICCLFLLYSIQLISQDIKEKAEEMITSAFPYKITYSSESFKLPLQVRTKIEHSAGQRFYGESVHLYKIFERNKKIAYAFIDNVKGKVMPITFLVIIDPKGKIISTGIIKYREAYGGAVQQEKWNKQFEGKDSSSGFKLGEDVSGISGATISARAVTHGIKKIILLFNDIKEKL